MDMKYAYMLIILSSDCAVTAALHYNIVVVAAAHHHEHYMRSAASLSCLHKIQAIINEPLPNMLIIIIFSSIIKFMHRLKSS